MKDCTAVFLEFIRLVFVGWWQAEAGESKDHTE